MTKYRKIKYTTKEEIDEAYRLYCKIGVHSVMSHGELSKEKWLEMRIKLDKRRTPLYKFVTWVVEIFFDTLTFLFWMTILTVGIGLFLFVFRICSRVQ